ncbi:MAG: hypothetical protein AAFP20_04015 [Cyanobacteria bacterium J06614_10]
MTNSSPLNGDMDTSDELSATQAALLQAVLDTEQSAPWLAEGAAEYETRLESAGAALEISEEEAAAGWQGLSAQLSQIWTEATSGVVAENAGVLAQLQQRFGERLPGHLLTVIADKAQQAARGAEPMVAQMISCVQDEFAQLAVADLQVMARPMAFAMRGNSADELVEATIQSIRVGEWETLSPIEQARLSLAAARYAIAQTESA